MLVKLKKVVRRVRLSAAVGLSLIGPGINHAPCVYEILAVWIWGLRVASMKEVS